MHLGIRGLPQYRRGISPTAVLGPQGALTVPPILPLDGERVGAVRSGPSGSAIGTLRLEWQCHPHGTARSGPSGSAIHTATWHRAYQSGTLRPEWQCDRYAQARVAVPPTLPLDIERAGAVRSGPSGSAIHTGLHVQARVAVPSTRDCTFRPEWQCYPHCHSTLNVWGQYAQARVAVRVGVTFGSVGVMPTSERLDRGVPQPRPGRPPRKWQSVSVREGRFLGRFG